MSRNVSDPAVTVLGSLMVDLVWRPPSLPTPGETVLAPGFESVPGGKGANQVRRRMRIRSILLAWERSARHQPQRGSQSARGNSGAQALSAKRAGVRTRIIGAIGDDPMAPVALQVRMHMTENPSSAISQRYTSGAGPCAPWRGEVTPLYCRQPCTVPAAPSSHSPAHVVGGREC